MQAGQFVSDLYYMVVFGFSFSIIELEGVISLLPTEEDRKKNWVPNFMTGFNSVAQIPFYFKKFLSVTHVTQISTVVVELSLLNHDTNSPHACFVMSTLLRIK